MLVTVVETVPDATNTLALAGALIVNAVFIPVPILRILICVPENAVVIVGIVSVAVATFTNTFCDTGVDKVIGVDEYVVEFDNTMDDLFINKRLLAVISPPTDKLLFNDASKHSIIKLGVIDEIILVPLFPYKYLPSIDIDI
jgi:hypothetical protein